MPTVERKYALTKFQEGDYLLPSNDGATLWRICRGQPNEGWELWRWTHRVGPNAPTVSPEWADWEFYEGYHKTRASAIKTALEM